jgi:hypothetical protein
MINNSIVNIKNCYGYDAYIISCHSTIIKLELDNSGFYQPVVFDVEKWTKLRNLSFGICIHYNRFLFEKPDEITCYTAWSNNKNIRYQQIGL